MDESVEPRAAAPVVEAVADGDRAHRPLWLRAAPFLGRPPDLTRRQWRVLGLVATASFFDQYDLYLFSLALKQIQMGLAIPEEQVGYLGSLVRFGALPAFLVALVADRIGRRRALLGTIVAYTLLTGATAFAPNAETFVALQFFARTFAIAELLLAVVVIAEEFDPDVRGWGIGALGAIQACGAGLAALLFALFGAMEDSWRGLYLVGLGPLVLLAWWRRTLPETPHFEARRAAVGDDLSVAAMLRPLGALVRMYPGRFAAGAAVAFLLAVAGAAGGFFGAKYLQEAHGWSPRATGFLVVAGGAFAIVGNTVAGRLSDRYGRKRIAISFVIGDVLLTALFYLSSGPALVPVWILMIFCGLGAGVTLSAFGSEMFPTSYRSTASGARMVVATLGASLGLALESVLYAELGSHWLAIPILVSVGLAGPVIIALGFPETAGRHLEEVSPERHAKGAET
jgi:putative MFS transporter